MVYAGLFLQLLGLHPALLRRARFGSMLIFLRVFSKSICFRIESPLERKAKVGSENDEGALEWGELGGRQNVVQKLTWLPRLMRSLGFSQDRTLHSQSFRDMLIVSRSVTLE